MPAKNHGPLAVRRVRRLLFAKPLEVPASFAAILLSWQQAILKMIQLNKVPFLTNPFFSLRLFYSTNIKKSTQEFVFFIRVQNSNLAVFVGQNKANDPGGMFMKAGYYVPCNIAQSLNSSGVRCTLVIMQEIFVGLTLFGDVKIALT